MADNISWDTKRHVHYSDVIMSAMSSQISGITSVYSTVYSSADKKRHQSCASLAFVRGIPHWPVNSTHKGPVTREMFPFDDVIMVLKVSKFVHNTFDTRASCMEQFVKVIIVMQWHGNSQADLRYSSLDLLWKWVFAHDLINLYKQS